MVTLETHRVRWSFSPGVDPMQLAPLLERALEVVDAGIGDLKDGRRKELYPLSLAGDQPDYLLKVIRYRPGVAWTRRLRRSKAKRALRVAMALAAAGIANPVPLAAGELRHRGLLIACFLLIPLAPDHMDLSQLWRDPQLPPSQRRAITVALGRLAQRMHAAGLLQPDFAPNNFLVRPDPLEITPIDFERAQLRTRLSLEQRNQMLAKLDRHAPEVGMTTRLRFSVAYAGNRAEARSTWQQVQQQIDRLARSDLERLRRRSTRDSRRYVSIRRGPWSGWARRDSECFEHACGDHENSDGVPSERVEARGRLWLCSYPAGDGGGIWALAQLLWIRRLSPKPICLFEFEGEQRLYLERESIDGEPQPPRAASRAAASVLFDRLLGIGEVALPLHPKSVEVRLGTDGFPRARLIDIAALRPSPDLGVCRRSRARELAAQLLG
jgi:tRNA A-37 threonylcarbamoyl transferase component Bud32